MDVNTIDELAAAADNDVPQLVSSHAPAIVTRIVKPDHHKKNQQPETKQDTKKSYTNIMLNIMCRRNI